MWFGFCPFGKYCREEHLTLLKCDKGENGSYCDNETNDCIGQHAVDYNNSEFVYLFNKHKDLINKIVTLQ